MFVRVSVLFHLIMPQLRGLCGHVKDEWDSHHSCMSCTGCSPSSKCSFCQEWSSATWRKALNRRTFQSWKCESDHLDLAPVVLALLCPVRAGKVWVPVISPPASDLTTSGHMLALPGPPVTG